VEIGLYSYRDLPNFPTAGSVSYGQLFDMADQYFRLASLDIQIDEMLTQDATVAASDVGFFYDSRVTRDSVKKTQNDIKADRRALMTAIQSCQPPAPCPYPASVAQTDYAYRAKLPVRNAAVASWNALQAAVSKQNADFAQLAAVGVTPDHLFDPSIHIPNASYGPIIDDARHLTAVITSLKQVQDSTNERYSLWVDSVSRQRCANSETAVCLDNVALDNIRASMGSAIAP
jgi:hypothetical protein